ncbi:hypothetical protein BI334_12480 [Moorena producens 3L]|nr:hypothetical protein BI334_12480 [Moorena producens 3L]
MVQKLLLRGCLRSLICYIQAPVGPPSEQSLARGTFRSKLTLVPPKVGGSGGQNSVSKNLGDIL